MNKEELFDALDEYYETKHRKELKEGFGWRIAERILIVVLVVAPAIYLLLNAPLFEMGDKKYNVLEASKIVTEIKDTQEDEQHLLSEYYSSLAGFSALVLSIIVGSTLFILSVNGHTKKQAKETIGLIVGIDGLLLAAVQFFR